MTNQLISVPFYKDTLYLVEHDGQPYTPARPIVDNIGLAWQVQHKKLINNKKRWGVTMMVIPSLGGGQKTICLPLRKLAGFLLSVDPRKVKPELRETVERYQEECDNALWDYWTKGQATNPRLPGPAPEPEPVKPVTFDRRVDNEEYIELLKTKIALLESTVKPKSKKKAAPPLTSQEAAEIHRLKKEGLSLVKIAKRIGRSTATVSFIVRGATVH